MRIHQVLKSKTDTSVVTVPPGTTLRAAADVLAQRKIGTVIVSGDGGKSALGIVSERDIVRVLAKRGGGVLTETVDQVMTVKLYTCTQEEEVDDALSIMTEKRFRHMPVVEDGRLVGLITLGDVVKARLSELAMERNALEGMIMGH